MTDSEFISSTHELRTLALRTGSAIVGTSCGEDIAQDAMLRLWNMRSDIRSAAHGRGLAVSISRHLAVDHLRRYKPTAVTYGTLRTAASLEPTPHERMVMDEDEDWLLRKLASLPTRQYMVLRLRQVERKSAEEIAAIMGISPGSVPTLLARARHAMLEELRRRLQ